MVVDHVVLPSGDTTYPKKANPADHLSRQSISSANLTKYQVREENNKLIEQMRFPTDASEQQIQKILTEVVQRYQCPRSVQAVLSKLNFEDSSQTEVINENCILIIHHRGISIEKFF